jgi:hypothetical protein
MSRKSIKGRIMRRLNACFRDFDHSMKFEKGNIINSSIQVKRKIITPIISYALLNAGRNSNFRKKIIFNTAIAP